VGRRQLDWLVIAGFNKDQISALPDVLERYPVGNVLWAGEPSENRAAFSLQQSLSEASITPVQAQAG